MRRPIESPITSAPETGSVWYDKDRMKKPHTYLFSLEVAPLRVGETYEVLPLHCTLMPRFLSDMDVAELSALVRPLFQRTPPLQLLGGEIIAFGPQAKLVNKLRPSAKLQQLHMALYELLQTTDARYTETAWVGKGYIPHISNQADAAISPGANQIVAAIYLIEVEYPTHGTRKFIRQRFELRP